MYSPPPAHRPNDVIWTPYHDLSPTSLLLAGTPASGTFAQPGANNAYLLPMLLNEPMPVLKAFVCNGATVGTDSWDIGVYAMTDLSTGRVDLIRSTGAVLSAGSVNVAAESGTWKIARTMLLNTGSTTDQDTYTTASVTLKAGRLYTMHIENSHASSAPAVSSITGGPTWTSRATVQYNTNLNRVSVWSGVPTVDYTGTIAIFFGASSGNTGAIWHLLEESGVDTATNDGIVQTITATGNSTTPSATLGAFGSTANATVGAVAVANTSGTAPGTGFTELSDTNLATPNQALEVEWRVDNDTSVDATVTSGQWGIIAYEVKASTTSFVIPQNTPSQPIYFAFVINGTTATIFRSATNTQHHRSIGALQLATAFPLPSTATVTALSTACRPLVGVSSRSLLA